MSRLRTLRRHILPSRRMCLYVMGIFLIQFMIILFVLVAILQSLDLLNRSDDIVDATGSSASLIRYIAWRLPELVSQFVPFAVLLAALFSMFSLAKHSELTVMRAAGLAPVQVLTPLVIASLFVGFGHFIFHDSVTVPSSHKLKVWQDSDYATTLSLSSDSRSDIWLTDDHQVIESRFASRVGEQIILDDVTIYTRSEEGLVIQSIAAEFAVYNGRRWTLYNVRMFDLEGHAFKTYEKMDWDFKIPVDHIFAYSGRPEHTRLLPLSKDIKTLASTGGETYTLRTNLHHRIAQSLSSLMMPFLAIFVGFGLPRRGVLVGRVILGMAVGFGYFVVDNYLTAMGSMGVVPPVMASYVALCLFMLVSVSFLLRLR